MYYTEEEAGKVILAAGRRLLAEELCSRTWGNISARISEDECLITPSGRAYEDLQPKDLVKVKISDGSWSGQIKPSSEIFLHTACYRLRPEAGFIIHTHQFYATSVSAAGRDTETAPCAVYGPPGTKRLGKKVARCVAAHPDKKAFLMQRHGAVFLGDSAEDAFALAERLETECRTLFLLANPAIHNYGKIYEEYSDEDRCFFVCRDFFGTAPAYIDDFAQLIGPEADLNLGFDALCTGEDAEAAHQILVKNCAAMLYASGFKASPMKTRDAKRQRKSYITSYSKLKETNHE